MLSASASQRCTSPAIVASSRWRPGPAPGSPWPISAANKLTSASADADAVLRDRLARSRAAACDDAVFGARCAALSRGVLREAVAGLVAPASLVCPAAGLAAAAAGATVGAATPDAAASAGASSAGNDSSMATAGAALATTSGALAASESACAPRAVWASVEEVTVTRVSSLPPGTFLPTVAHSATATITAPRAMAITHGWLRESGSAWAGPVAAPGWAGSMRDRMLGVAAPDLLPKRLGRESSGLRESLGLSVKAYFSLALNSGYARPHPAYAQTLGPLILGLHTILWFPSPVGWVTDTHAGTMRGSRKPGWPIACRNMAY
jgi:hypothetical protein